MPQVDIVEDSEEQLSGEASLAWVGWQEDEKSHKDHDNRDQMADFLTVLESAQVKQWSNPLHDVHDQVKDREEGIQEN